MELLELDLMLVFFVCKVGAFHYEAELLHS